MIFCDRPFLHTHILSSGEVICHCLSELWCKDGKKIMSMGHLNDVRHFGDIWNGEKYNKLRNDICENSGEYIRVCKTCDLKYDIDVGINSFHNDSEIKNIIKPPLSPRYIQLEITTNCCYKCPVCHRELSDEVKERGDMGYDVFSKVLSGLTEDTKHIVLFGQGESLSSKKFFCYTKMIRSRLPDSYLTVCTNMYYVDSSDKARKLINCGLSRIELALYGTNEEEFKRYYGISGFNRVINNIKLLSEEYKKSKNKPEIVWKYILFKWNDSDESLDRLYEMSSKTGFRICFTTTVTPDDCESKKYRQNTEEYEKLLKKFNAQKLESYVQINIINMIKDKLRYIQGVSIPRSGHHLLARCLSNYFNRNEKTEDFYYCGAYGNKGCRKHPCIDKKTIYQKGHDGVIEIKREKNSLYLFQLRKDFIAGAISEFKLYTGNGNCKFIKREWDIRLEGYVKEWERLIKKWYIEKSDNVFTLSFEDIISDPFKSFGLVIPFFSPGHEIDYDLLSEVIVDENINLRNYNKDFKFYDSDDYSKYSNLFFECGFEDIGTNIKKITRKNGIIDEVALSTMFNTKPKLKKTIIFSFSKESFEKSDSGTILYFMNDGKDPVMAFRKEGNVLSILFHNGIDWDTIKTEIPCNSNFEVKICGKGLGDIFINEKRFTEIIDAERIVLVYGDVVDFMTTNRKYPDPEPDISRLIKSYK